MNFYASAPPDPSLAQKTRGSHLVLFTIGCFLMLPAAAVFALMAMAMEEGAIFNLNGEELGLVFTAALTSTTGVLAWAALGLLLTKPARPKWHFAAWSLVLSFGIFSVPACIYWLAADHHPQESIKWIVATVLMIGVVCALLGARNLSFTRASFCRRPEEPHPLRPLEAGGRS
ncbi:hypothetical protein [Haloferula sp. BvORR071]|uniref:hypothetical protein n=1 Tax=Haloferula sp. BvORR071 TaxID=1396141 RepID=UPI0005541C2C|nr:hypothetical protein [Haloferula sp. BvORR071]